VAPDVTRGLVPVRLMVDLLYGVPPADPVTFLAMSARSGRPRSMRATFPRGGPCASIQLTCCGTN